MFSINISYCRKLLEAEDMSSARNGAGSQHNFVTHHSMHDDLMMKRKVSSCEKTESKKTRRKIRMGQGEAANMEGRSSGTERREAVDDVCFLVLRRSLEESPSNVQRMWEGDGVVAQDLYSSPTFGFLHSFHSNVPGLL